MDSCESSKNAVSVTNSRHSVISNNDTENVAGLESTSHSAVKKVNFATGNHLEEKSYRSDRVSSNEVEVGDEKNLSGNNGLERVVQSVNNLKIVNNVSETSTSSNNLKKDEEKREESSCSSSTEVEKTDDPGGPGIEEMLDRIDSGQRRKHIFILSSAGKPVYTRYGSEDKLVTLFGVMQALVSVVQDGDDSLLAIKCGKTCIAFLAEGPIILVGVVHKNESLDFVRRKLNYIYSQVVSILTLTQLTKIFEERHNYDLRRLLSGSERIIDHLLTFSETRPEFLLDSISCLQMAQSARDAVSNTIVSSCSKIKNLVFAILIGNNRIISIVSLKKYKLEPCDIHLICNLVNSAESFKTAESWTPICLPKFNPSGYLHAHVSYLTDCPACLLLLTVEKDSFFELSGAKTKIEGKLKQNQSIIILKAALSQMRLPSTKNIDIPHVRHFIYKSCTNSQLFFSEIIEPYETQEKWSDLLVKYEHLHSCMMNETQPLKVLYQQLANEVMLGWVTKKFELYAVFEPLVQKSDCINTVDKLLQWVQKEEEKLFMLNYFYFN